MSTDLNILKYLTITKYLRLCSEGTMSSESLWDMLKKNYLTHQDCNAYLEFFTDYPPAPNAIPIAIKDMFLMQGKKCTAASKMLENFTAPYTSTVVDRLTKNNFFATGRTNMDEFAMGSSGITSAFGPTLTTIKNKNGEVMSPGGSSSGSAVALLTNTCLAALGSDTGGSVRTPAAWTGSIGYKPTYGLFSRYGMIPLVVPFDAPSLFTKSVDDTQFIFNHLIGKDPLDFTSVDYKAHISGKKRIGLMVTSADYIQEELKKSAKYLESQGYEVVLCDISLLKYTLPIYYILGTSDMSSNLDRFSGVFYGEDVAKSTIDDIYTKTRSLKFGKEVQRRIVVGNYVSYAGNVDGYYTHARKLLQKVWLEVKEILDHVDCILMPTTTGVGLTLNECYNPDPTVMYNMDLYTVLANLLGLPAIHIPTGTYEGLPIGVQLVGAPMADTTLFHIGKLLHTHYYPGFYN